MHRNIHLHYFCVEVSKTKFHRTVHYECQQCCGGKSLVFLTLRHMMNLDVHVADS